MTTTIYDRLTSAEMVTDFDAFMAKAKTAKGIIEQVSNQTMIPVHDLLGKKRDHPTAHARQLCFYRIQRECNYSLPRIGRLFGRDHTTVMHGIRQEEKRQADMNDQNSARRRRRRYGKGKRIWWDQLI